MSKSRQYDFIQQLIKEADSYHNPNHFDQLAATGQMPNIPLQPLAMAFRQMNASQVARYLPHLSREQRSALLDLDLWHRDHLQVQDFAFWMEAYHLVPSWELKVDFVQSEQFALYLKGVMGVATFDEEDPQYPEHDNFFLTDDHLLLIEYHESFRYVDELRNLLRIFYSRVGVEKAYAHLFKIVSDSFLIFQEDQYRLKKERLRDYGLIDYYDALEALTPMGIMAQVEAFIQSRQAAAGRVDSRHRNQVLAQQTLVAYQEQEFAPVHRELAKVTEAERADFLHFNFIRLVNATLSLEDAWRQSALSMARVGKETRYFLLLGLAYLKSVRHFGPAGVFEIFDFFDVCRIGKSIIHSHRIRLKRALARSGFDSFEKETFLGASWQSVLDGSFRTPIQIQIQISQTGCPRSSPAARDVYDRKDFDDWCEQIQLLMELLPFMARFCQSYGQMVEQGEVRDDYYLNYQLSEVDFEVLILSSFINFDLGHYREQNHRPKMGLSIEEVRAFGRKYFDNKWQPDSLNQDNQDTQNTQDNQEGQGDLRRSFEQFLSAFGLPAIGRMGLYLHLLLNRHLSGYDLASMPEDEFRYVGGPIIFKRPPPQ